MAIIIKKKTASGEEHFQKVKKREFKLPGQKRDTPPKSDPLYKFYMSLLKQNPNSEMALKWCLEHGIFNEKKAEQVSMMFDMKKLTIKK